MENVIDKLITFCRCMDAHVDDVNGAILAVADMLNANLPNSDIFVLLQVEYAFSKEQSTELLEKAVEYLEHLAMSGE